MVKRTSVIDFGREMRGCLGEDGVQKDMKGGRYGVGIRLVEVHRTHKDRGKCK